LRELLEQLTHLIGSHADAGVGHSNRDPVAVVLLPLASGNGHGALLGEFVGVACEVEQRLPETVWSA